MTAGLAALRDDEIHADRFEMLRFRDGRGGAADQDAERLELAHALDGEVGEMRSHGARLDALDCVELRRQVRCVRRRDRLRRAEAEVGVVMRDRVECGALLLHFARVWWSKEGDEGRRLWPATYPS